MSWQFYTIDEETLHNFDKTMTTTFMKDLQRLINLRTKLAELTDLLPSGTKIWVGYDEIEIYDEDSKVVESLASLGPLGKGFVPETGKIEYEVLGGKVKILANPPKDCKIEEYEEEVVTPERRVKVKKFKVICEEEKAQ